jgi:phospholipid-translocating ATPase
LVLLQSLTVWTIHESILLLIGLLQLIPQATPVDPITTLGPLVFIFTVSAIKEAVDDYGRWKADKVANERLFTVLRNDGQRQTVQSQQIVVGDLLFLEDGMHLPCDVALLWTSDPEGGAFTMTANLDGETDLKPRAAAPGTQALGAHAAGCFAGELECPAPNAHVYRFDARFKLERGGEWQPLGLHNTLWQSTQLRNTASAIGIAVYCGGDTKLGQNKAKPPTKWTKLDRFINRLTAFIFCAQFVCVLIFAAIGIAWAVTQWQSKAVSARGPRLALVDVAADSGALSAAQLAHDSDLAQGDARRDQVHVCQVCRLGPSTSTTPTPICKPRR